MSGEVEFHYSLRGFGDLKGRGDGRVEFIDDEGDGHEVKIRWQCHGNCEAEITQAVMTMYGRDYDVREDVQAVMEAIMDEFAEEAAIAAGHADQDAEDYWLDQKADQMRDDRMTGDGMYDDD